MYSLLNCFIKLKLIVNKNGILYNLYVLQIRIYEVELSILQARD